MNKEIEGTETVDLPRGLYVVKLGEMRRKVVVR